MTIRVITPPAVEPVSLETARSFLRVDGNEDDALITSLIKAAREEWENLSRRACITQTLEMVINGWPRDYQLTVLRPPLQSIISVTYRDRESNTHIWTDFLADINSDPGRIIFRSLPGAALLESGGVQVRYLAGYGDTVSDVPERIKLDILQLVALWYEERVAGSIPAQLRLQITAERTVWF